MHEPGGSSKFSASGRQSDVPSRLKPSSSTLHVFRQRRYIFWRLGDVVFLCTRYRAYIPTTVFCPSASQTSSLQQNPPGAGRRGAWNGAPSLGWNLKVYGYYTVIRVGHLLFRVAVVSCGNNYLQELNGSVGISRQCGVRCCHMERHCSLLQTCHMGIPVGRHAGMWVQSHCTGFSVSALSPRRWQPIGYTEWTFERISRDHFRERCTKKNSPTTSTKKSNLRGTSPKSESHKAHVQPRTTAVLLLYCCIPQRLHEHYI